LFKYCLTKLIKQYQHITINMVRRMISICRCSYRYYITSYLPWLYFVSSQYYFRSLWLFS